MSDSNPAPKTIGDLQDPLPEASWLWRRVFCFAVTAGLLFFMWGFTDRLGKVAVLSPREGIPALLAVSKWTIGFAALVVTYYLLAPSAEQITKLVKTASLLKSGVQIASRAVVRTPERQEEATATVGLPPAPPIPAQGSTVAPVGAAMLPSTDDSPPSPPVALQADDVEAARQAMGSYFDKGAAK